MVKSRAIGNIFLVLFSVAVSVAVVEGFLAWRPEFQALAPDANFVFCAGQPQSAQPRKLSGWSAVPDSAYFEQKSEADGWAVYIYNANGFRDLLDSGDEHVIVLGQFLYQRSGRE